MGDMCLRMDWSTRIPGERSMFISGCPRPHPRVNSENAVIKDIEKWEEQLTVPDLDHLDWTLVKEEAAKVDRREKFVGFMCAGGFLSALTI